MYAHGHFTLSSNISNNCVYSYVSLEAILPHTDDSLHGIFWAQRSVFLYLKCVHKQKKYVCCSPHKEVYVSVYLCGSIYREISTLVNHSIPEKISVFKYVVLYCLLLWYYTFKLWSLVLSYPVYCIRDICYSSPKSVTMIHHYSKLLSEE